jgi:hypothetical protein
MYHHRGDNIMTLGTASIKVYLKAGHITVLHGDTGKVLLERKAFDGDWSLIWNALEGYNG